MTTITFDDPEDSRWVMVGGTGEDGEPIDTMWAAAWATNQAFGPDKGGMRSTRYTMKLSDELNRYDYSDGPIGYLWAGAALLPPVLLTYETAPVQGDTDATLNMLAGLDGSVAGAVRGAALDVPAASAVVRSDRVLAPARKGLFGTTPERLEVRWAMRVHPQDFLLTLGPVPLEHVAQAVADAEALIRTVSVTEQGPSPDA